MTPFTCILKLIRLTCMLTCFASLTQAHILTELILRLICSCTHSTHSFTHLHAH
uniref:Uncharacterized protein n=1 Tax=Anguilla anguilla TaxID=7936 RepID=A0A0E9U1W5_ANGAN